MPRARRNDPAGVSSTPNLVTDPEREAAIVTEAARKLRYMAEAYRIERSLRLDSQSVKADLRRLRKCVLRPHVESRPQRRLSPWLELAINEEARTLAGLSPDDVLRPEHDELVQKAARAIAKRAKLIRGRPRPVLRRYVEAAIAVIQEGTGMPVTAARDKDSVYAPHLGILGQVIRTFVDTLQPGVTDVTLVSWIRAIRRANAGKLMRFIDYFPVYGASFDDSDGTLSLQPPYRLEQLTALAAISCP